MKKKAKAREGNPALAFYNGQVYSAASFSSSGSYFLKMRLNKMQHMEAVTEKPQIMLMAITRPKVVVEAVSKNPISAK